MGVKEGGNDGGPIFARCKGMSCPVDVVDSVDSVDRSGLGVHEVHYVHKVHYVHSTMCSYPRPTRATISPTTSAMVRSDVSMTVYDSSQVSGESARVESWVSRSMQSARTLS